MDVFRMVNGVVGCVMTGLLVRWIERLARQNWDAAMLLYIRARVRAKKKIPWPIKCFKSMYVSLTLIYQPNTSLFTGTFRPASMEIADGARQD